MVVLKKEIVDVDMNRDESCLGTWQKTTTPRRLCLESVTAGCTSAHFDVKGVSCEHICGQTKSYQKNIWMLLQEHCNQLITFMLMVFPYRYHVWT